jgi:hypothetical protein
VTEEQKEKTIAEAFEELRKICEEEGYELLIPERVDRPQPDFDEE